MKFYKKFDLAYLFSTKINFVNNKKQINLTIIRKLYQKNI